MTRHSLLDAFVALVGAGTIPGVVRLLTATYARPAHRAPRAPRAPRAARAGRGVRSGTGGRRQAANDRQVSAHRVPDLAGGPGCPRRYQDLQTPAGLPRTAVARPVHGGNVLVDRGHGYVL